MALGERKQVSTRGPTPVHSARNTTSSGLHEIDDLYENNAFGEDQDDDTFQLQDDRKSQPKRGPTKRVGVPSTPESLSTPMSNSISKSSALLNKASSKQKEKDNSTSGNRVDFDVWVTRKDKYERVSKALSQLNVERAAEEDKWFEVAVSLAATDCLLKTGKTDKCDCEGICHEPAHAVSRQRTRCQCPAKKCSICNRCIGTEPGAITEKMMAVLAPYRTETSQTYLEIAERVLEAGEGRVLNSGGTNVTTAALRMAQTVINQCSILENADGTKIQRPCTCPIHSLGDLWIKWTTKYHTFSGIELSEAEASKFSSATRQLMEFNEETKSYYMTLKWHMAAKPQKGDTAKIAARRALTADQKKQNAFFLTLCKKYWLKAQHRVVELLQEKTSKKNKNGTEEEEDDQVQDVKGSTRSRSKGKKLTQEEMEISLLNQVGVKRLLKWVEEDSEAIEEKKNEEKKEKAENGAIAHSAWLKRKDRLRIRMPVEEETADPVSSSYKPPRFDFSGKGLVRKQQHKAPSSTVELMRGSGLKYVHAMNEGFQGRGGDLEKCRELLVKQGHIYKDNFAKKSGNDQYGDEDDGGNGKDRYLFEKQNNSTLKKKKEKDTFREETSKESYSSWLSHKALKDKAIKYLDHITKPKEMDEDDEDSVVPSVRWEEVGKALKAVDRGLLDEWIKWSEGFRSSTRCRILWESFTPIACDVHCTSSALRDVFLKLLHRKQVNYKEAFLNHCDKKYRKAIARNDDSVPDEMTEEEKMERFNTLNPKEFSNLLLDLGIVLQMEEIMRVVDYFDSNGDGLVTMNEFLSVTGEERSFQCHGDTAYALKEVCMWETVCHECGMLNAFQLVIGSTKPGASRMRAELPGHEKRREQMARFDCQPECDMRKVKENAPKICDFAQWSDEKAMPFLKKLEVWSAENREQHIINQLVTEGQPPDAATLFRDDDESLDPTSMILLRWNPPLVRKNNGPAFYILETAGAEGSASFRQNEFREVYRDPKDFQDNNGEPRYHYVVTGLSPNTKYLFRIRALNGFGASPYTFGYFYTCPAVPPAPMPVKVTANSIHLAWETSKYYEKQLKELRELFDEADVDGNGCISRDEFMEEIERRKPRLMEFLQKMTVTKETGDGKKLVPLSIFDAIETDDNESISWEEFMRFFHSTLDLKSETGSVAGGNDTRSVRSSSTMRSTTISRSSMGTTARKSSAGNTSSMQCRYILKQCTNESQGEYVEIYRGTKPSFVVHGLASGSPYQFRVQAYNDEEIYSLHSESTIVNTLLQTPSAPLLGETPSCSSVRIKWPAATAKPSLSHETLQAKSKASNSNLKKGAKNDDNVARLLKEWAQETTLDDGTIDFRGKFDRYDVDKSNFIELPEFRTLLEELGVTPTEERIAAYLDEFDTDSDGKISFEEFKEWWNKTDVHYVLKRDTGSQATSSATAEVSGGLANEAQERGSQMSIVSYRGKDTWTIVNGLEPNTAYTFRLRTVSSHASSNLSDSLEIVTAASAPSCAGVVSTLPNQVTLCWYPGMGGASKYHVECKFMETLPSVDGTSVATRKVGIISTNGEWCRAYEGSDSLVTLYDLLPNSVYRVRVYAVNRNGVISEQSTVSQFNTLAKEEERMYTLRPSNAADHFVIECAQEGDIVAGDTILFSERLYKTESGKIVEESHPGARSSSTNGATGLARTGFFNPNASITSNGSVVGGEAVGERTVAARVVNINESGKYGRFLSMEVVWNTVQMYGETGNTTTRKGNMSARGSTRGGSGPATVSASYIHPTDSKIQRKERSLYKYEAFRCEWQDEKARHPSTWEK